uniref:Uncharacterized protein n=1 Tax=Sander lucioperca TaxID=283035 RepID=A0A8C9YL32_SANLU
MSSMDWPFSSFFSISTSSLTPSTTICTSSTSEKPSLSALEMSKTPPTAAVSTPPRWRQDTLKKLPSTDSKTKSSAAINCTALQNVIMMVVQTSSTFLEPQLLENLLELGMFAHVWQLDVHTRTQAGAQVRRAGEDVAQVLIPHEGMVSFLEQGLNLNTREPG